MKNKLKTLLAFLFLILLLSPVAYKMLATQVFAPKKTPPPVFVSSALATTTTWHQFLTAVGTISAINGVDLSPQTAGVVTEITFTSGQFVKQNDLILQLDPAVLQAEYESGAAKLKQKQLTYERYEKILKSGAVTDDQVDTARADMLQATADVKQLRAKLEQLSIRAPFSGKLGLRLVNLGQYLPAGTVVTSLQSVDPIQVTFSIASKDMSLLKVGQAIRFAEDAHPDKPVAGTITAIDSRIDPETRSIDVEATLPNPTGDLVPGLFGTVNVDLPTQNNVVVVPQSALNYTLYGDSVYVLTPGTAPDTYQAKLVYIQKGEQRDNLVTVLKGLKAGDQVVTSGQLKLYEGATVKINNQVEL